MFNLKTTLDSLVSNILKVVKSAIDKESKRIDDSINNISFTQEELQEKYDERRL